MIRDASRQRRNTECLPHTAAPGRPACRRHTTGRVDIAWSSAAANRSRSASGISGRGAAPAVVAAAELEQIGGERLGAGGGDLGACNAAPAHH
jgi:hypothetical protein